MEKVIDKAQKPIHVKPSFYAMFLEPLKACAKEYGYNLVLHGSMNRDLDLILIPWQDEVGDEAEMIGRFCEIVDGKQMMMWDEKQKKAIDWNWLPGGRRNYVINVCRGGYYGKENAYMDDPQFYLDISITPLIVNDGTTQTIRIPGQ